MRPVAVGIIGARRRRQGLGPFVARWLVSAGAEVPCFLGTSDETVAEAGEALQRVAGVTARGHTDGAAMVAGHRLDALAVLSPPAFHAEGLDLALRAGLHALCEKPLLWGGDDDLVRARALVASFHAAGLVLHEDCQWPQTLAAYERLHPGALAGPIGTFEMWMQPASSGARMLVDALSHPISLLQAIAPGAEVALDDIGFSDTGPDADDVKIRFTWRARPAAGGRGVARDVAVSVRLSTAEGQPRRAGYAVDGRRAEREIRREDYALSFSDADRRVDVPDPLAALVAGFVAQVARAREGSGEAGTEDPAAAVVRGESALQRLTLLHDLVAAWRAAHT